jgi:hypothetical protein
LEDTPPIAMAMPAGDYLWFNGLAEISVVGKLTSGGNAQMDPYRHG